LDAPDHFLASDEGETILDVTRPDFSYVRECFAGVLLKRNALRHGEMVHSFLFRNSLAARQITQVNEASVAAMRQKSSFHDISAA